ncbi:MAG: AsmA-like C-terminal region-containing protein, partial [Pseudomonadota bacterium]
HADLDVSVGILEMSEAVDDLRDASFAVRLRETSLDVFDLDAAFLGGRLSGALQLENNNGEVSASGTLELIDADVAAISWTDGQRPLVEGKFSLSGQYNGTGRSLDAIVSSLGGDGSLTLEHGRIRRVNPVAFGLVLDAADGEITLDAETLSPIVSGHLDAGSLTVDRAEAAFRLASGVIRVANVSFDTDSVDTSASATVDLTTMRLKGAMSLIVEAADIDDTPVSGSTPEIAIVFDGPFEEPTRTLDLQPLLGYLTVRRFEQEVRRVEILQADILEKQRLSRYARWISAQEARERRLKEQAERRRLEQIELNRLEADIESRNQTLEQKIQQIRDQNAQRASSSAQIEAERRAARIAADAARRQRQQGINLERELQRLEQEGITTGENLQLGPVLQTQ